MEILGIDIGGSGIKGAPVDIVTGKLTAARYRIETPEPSHPLAVIEVIAQIIEHFAWEKRPLGCTYPGVIKQGVTLTAANVDKAWIGLNAAQRIFQRTQCSTLLLNDADAAGMAEMELGAGKGILDTVIMLTLGTGIGSAIFTQGCLLPNTEFGHLEIRGKEAEHRAAARIRKEKDLSWEAWSELLNEFLARMEGLFSPDLLILGGGVSRKSDKFLHLLQTHAKIVPAHFHNQAGIVGAALAQARQIRLCGQQHHE
jgi:polyphosphate glucokinase